MTGRRALLWSASPILVLYAFHNWDLPAVAASVAGALVLVAGEKRGGGRLPRGGRRPEVYPALFLIPLVLDRVHAGGPPRRVPRRGGRRGDVRPREPPDRDRLPEGWAIPFRFQALRRPNPDSLWGVLATDLRLEPGAVNAFSTAAVALAAAGRPVGVRTSGAPGRRLPVLRAARRS